jgi:hypothetical protein
MGEPITTAAEAYEDVLRIIDEESERLKNAVRESRMFASSSSASTVASQSRKDGSVCPSPQTGRDPVAISYSVTATE